MAGASRVDNKESSREISYFFLPLKSEINFTLIGQEKDFSNLIEKYGGVETLSDSLKSSIFFPARSLTQVNTK